MTQEEFDKFAADKKAMHRYWRKSMQECFAEEMREDRRREKACIEEMRAQIERPINREKKARHEAYHMQRFLVKQIFAFCEDKKGLTAEDAEVSFTINENNVIFEIAINKQK